MLEQQTVAWDFVVCVPVSVFAHFFSFLFFSFLFFSKQKKKALENVKQRLIRLNCLLHLEWPADGRSPALVVRLERVDRRHVDAVLGAATPA